MHIPTKSIFSRAHVREAAIDKLFAIPAKKVAETESRISSVNVEYICCTVRFFTCKKTTSAKKELRAKAKN